MCAIRNLIKSRNQERAGVQALRSSGVSVGSQAAAFFHRNGKPGFRMG